MAPVYRDGSESDTEQVCRTLQKQTNILISTMTGVRGRNIYRAIATNKDELSDPEHFYNQRGESSENRIKELRSDFAAARFWGFIAASDGDLTESTARAPTSDEMMIGGG